MSARDHKQADGTLCPHPLATCPNHGTRHGGSDRGILDNPNAGGSMLSFMRSHSVRYVDATRGATATGLEDTNSDCGYWTWYNRQDPRRGHLTD